MKKKDLLIILFFLLSCAAVIVFCYIQPAIIDDAVGNSLLNDCIGRCAASLAFIAVAILLGYENIFTENAADYGKALLWCVPCLLVVAVNFPFSALIRGTAVIERYDLLGIFILDCFSVALMEEVLFRGILLSVLLEIFKENRVTAILVQSAVFAICHLFNLFSGASVGETLLQVGYTFLLAIMFSSVCVRTKNIRMAVLLHALFNVGGNIIPTLGSGAFQDEIFWILTIIAAVLCATHIIYSYVKAKSNEPKIK